MTLLTWNPRAVNNYNIGYVLWWYQRSFQTARNSRETRFVVGLEKMILAGNVGSYNNFTVQDSFQWNFYALYITIL